MKFNDVYKKIISNKNVVGLNWKEKKTMAPFVVVQEIRTREMREMFRSIAEELQRVISNKHVPLSNELERQLNHVLTEKSFSLARSLSILMLGRYLSPKRNGLKN